MMRALRLDDSVRERAVLAAAAACALTGIAMAMRPGLAPVVAVAAILAALSIDWRRGVLALLVVLPFAGLPVFIAGAPGLALRDVAVTAPLYIAFGLAMLRSDENALSPLGVGVPALALFAALVVVGVVRAPSLTVGVIGAKVWLAYIPMLAIGYRFVRRADDFEGVLRITALVGLVPAAVALSECLLATRATQVPFGPWINHFGPFDGMYGAWFEHVRYSAVAFGPDGHAIVIPRVPSTFTGATQYFGFAMAAYAAGLAMALRRRTGWWALCAIVLGAAAIASGVRLAYVAVPAMSLLAFILAGVPMRWTAGATLVAVALLASASIAGANPVRVASMIPAHAQQQLRTASREFDGALTSGIAGHGTGWDTNAALRYGSAGETRFIENWYAKAALELGIIGLVSIVVAFAAMGVRLAAPWGRLDARSRQLAAPVLALLAVMALALFKGPYIDLDPMNVYFWLLAGMLAGLYRAAGATAESRKERRGEFGST